MLRKDTVADGTPLPELDEIHILWTSEGMRCDSDTASITAALRPTIEAAATGLIPGLPKVHLHDRVLGPSLGGGRGDFLEPFFKAASGELGAPFILVVEGPIHNEDIHRDGFWTSMGNGPDTGEPKTLNTWLDELAPRAWAVVSIGTCATHDGIHAMAGNPMGCMGLADYLGWDFRSAGGLPIVNVPGCPVQPDKFVETLTWVLYQAAGLAPVIPLDEQLRPTWLFGPSVHEGCDRAGYYEHDDFALDHNSSRCQVKIGCRGPVVNCSVPKRGWMSGIGDCPNVGGICIGCAMPGFPDAFMPFMDRPPRGTVSSDAVGIYGNAIRRLRDITNRTVNPEPRWRHRPPEPTTGYDARYPHGNGGS